MESKREASIEYAIRVLKQLNDAMVKDKRWILATACANAIAHLEQTEDESEN